MAKETWLHPSSLRIHIPIHELPLGLYPGRHEQLYPSSLSLQICSQPPLSHLHSSQLTYRIQGPEQDFPPHLGRGLVHVRYWRALPLQLQWSIRAGDHPLHLPCTATGRKTKSVVAVDAFEMSYNKPGENRWLTLSTIVDKKPLDSYVSLRILCLLRLLFEKPLRSFKNALLFPLPIQ